MDRHAITRRQLLAGMSAAGALAVAGRVAPSRGAASATPTPLVRIDPGTPLGRLDNRALGFSFERATLSSPLFDDDNADLVGLFTLLGPGSLRIGAKTVDTTPFDPTGSGRTAGTVAPSDLAALRRFADAADWDVLHGLPFVHAGSSPATAAAEAEVAVAALGDRLRAYEVGNEPDLYVLDAAYSPLAGTLELCRARWEAFAGAVVAADPATPLTGPGCCLLQSLGGWTTPFVAAESASLAMVTQHYYRGFGGAGQTIDSLLAPDPLLTSSLATLASLAGEASAAGSTGFRLTETNSFASGGQPGVSNSFASALWAIGHVLDCTAAGASGLDFHNSGAGAGYPAIVQIGGTVTEVRPLYYGLLLVASLGPGTHLATSVIGLPPTVRVHGVAGDDGDFRVVVRNLDADAPVTVDIDLGTPLSAASFDRLEGPSLAATSGVTLRGAPVQLDGTWDRDASEDLVVSGATFSVTVAPASAVVVWARPAPAAPSTTEGIATTTTLDPSTSQSTVPPTTDAVTTSTTGTDAVPTMSQVPSIAPPAQPVVARPTFTG